MVDRFGDSNENGGKEILPFVSGDLKIKGLEPANRAVQVCKGQLLTIFHAEVSVPAVFADNGAEGDIEAAFSATRFAGNKEQAARTVRFDRAIGTFRLA